MSDQIPPTEQDILQLPRWAQVALAARCVRRVFPVFKHLWKTRTKEQIDAVSIAVSAAELSAATAMPTRFALVRPAHDAINPMADSRFIASCLTAYMAGVSTRPNYLPPGSVLYTAADAIDQASRAADFISEDSKKGLVRAILNDFDLISTVAKKEEWSDLTTVDPGFFGPLWPNGIPQGWPEDVRNSNDAELILTKDSERVTAELDQYVKSLISQWQQQLKELLRGLNEQTDLFNVHAVMSHLNRLAFLSFEITTEVPTELLAEAMAFSFRYVYPVTEPWWSDYRTGSFVWTPGGPQGSTSLDQITHEVVSYWNQRALDVDHPILKALYADLTWQWSTKDRGIANRDPAMARMVIEASLLITEKSPRLPVSWLIWAKLSRAHHLAIILDDANLVEDVRDTIVEYEVQTAQDHDVGSWGLSFDLLVKGRQVRFPPNAELRTKIVAELESRFERLVNEADPSRINIHSIEKAALSLAEHYRIQGRDTETRRVLEGYADAVMRRIAKVPGSYGAAELPRVYERLVGFNLRDVAEKVAVSYRENPDWVRGKRSRFNVAPAPTLEQADAFLLLRSEWPIERLLADFARCFIPTENGARKRVRSNVTTHIFTGDSREVDATFTTKIENEMVMGYILNEIESTSGFFRRLVEKLILEHGLNVENTMQFLYQSPVFESNKKEIINRGLMAYFEQDWLVAIHLFVPQIEAVVREFLRLRGRSTLKKNNRNGSLMLKNLDELLNDERVQELFTKDVAAYLQFLLTDPSALNVRNEVCHGILPANDFGSIIADRLFQSLLFLALIRQEHITAPSILLAPDETDLKLSSNE